MSSRSYLTLTALAEAAAALPLVRPEDLLHAVGGATPPLMASLAALGLALGLSARREPSLDLDAFRS